MRELPVIQPEEAVVPAAGPGRGTRYRVEGMDCGACARTVERVVGALDGAEAVTVSFGAGTLELWGNVPAEQVEGAVARAGYRARPATAAAGPPVAFWRRDRRALTTAASIVLLAIAVTLDLAGAGRWTAEPVYLAAMAVGGYAIARAALAAARRGSLDMNVLMTVAAVGAVAIGSYAEGAFVLVLFALGTTLETYALDRTRRSVASIAEIAPETARVLDAAGERMVPLGEIVPGTTLLVRPGERVPLDGVVRRGASAVDESALTGESLPVDKDAGATVFGGTLNGFGAFEMTTTSDADGSTVARIAALVEQAQATRAPSERLVDRFASIYTPLVLAAAALVAVVPVLAGEDADTWIYRGLALLIVACPCSLVISIPVAAVSAIGAGARTGVLIKGGEALEDLADIRAVCLDKTGTLTVGAPELVSVRPAPGVSEAEALRLAATVERHSEHPLGAALVRGARDRGVAPGEPDRFLALPGRGADALVEGRALWVGGPRLAGERLDATAAAGLAGDGRTTLALGERDRLLATFQLADVPRPEAAAAVERLRGELGIERIAMLTGDGDDVAAAVGDATGVGERHAGLLPDDKLALVATIERETGAVAMVGDGINDAPALAAARVGIAMGAAGSAVALESADVALIADDLSRVPHAIGLARRTLRVMRQNIGASLLVKGAVLALVPFGEVTLWMAVAADMGMSLLVTANGLRLFTGRR